MQYLTLRKWHLTTIVLIIIASYFSVAGRNYIGRVLWLRANEFSDVAPRELVDVPPGTESECDQLVRLSDIYQTIGARLSLLAIAILFFAIWQRELEHAPWMNQVAVVGLIFLTVLQFMIV